MTNEILPLKGQLNAKRKFPNLVLNELRDHNFVFISSKVEDGTEKRLDVDKLGEIYEYVSSGMVSELGRMI